MDIHHVFEICPKKILGTGPVWLTNDAGNDVIHNSLDLFCNREFTEAVLKAKIMNMMDFLHSTSTFPH